VNVSGVDREDDEEDAWIEPSKGPDPEAAVVTPANAGEL